MTKGIRWSEHDYQALMQKRGLPTLANQHRKPYPKRAGPPELSPLEEELAQQMQLAGVRAPVRQHKPIEHRKIRMDFAWPELLIGAEVQGDVHRRYKERWQKEHERRALLLLAGWRVLEIDRHDIASGRALEWITQLLRQGESRNEIHS